MPSTITATLLPPNPVWRSYLGGSVLRRFRSLPAVDDDHFPEDWLASTVRARNAEHASGPLEGLSSVLNKGSSSMLLDLLRQSPNYWLGSSARPAANFEGLGVLWKLLDS